MDKGLFNDILLLFLSDTITMLDASIYYCNDCDRSPQYPMDQVYSRLVLYLFFTSGKLPAPEDVFLFLKQCGYPDEDIVIVKDNYAKSCLSNGDVHSTPSDKDVLHFFKLDTIDLINCVIQDNPEDYHFSAVMVYKRIRLLLQYSGTTDVTDHSVENFILNCGFDSREVDYIRERKENELTDYHGSN